MLKQNATTSKQFANFKVQKILSRPKKSLYSLFEPVSFLAELVFARKEDLDFRQWDIDIEWAPKHYSKSSSTNGKEVNRV